jgi:putative DNA primase/helicase
MMARIESALSFIPASDRYTWLSMAMAVKSELGESGFDMWDQWSQTAGNYNKHSARSVWKSCKGSGVTLGTLFHEAKENGWRDDDKYERPTAAQMQARQRDLNERMTQEGIEREKAQQAAAKKAGWILHQTKLEKHAYLDSKGWSEAVGQVWWPSEDQNLLCIPMRVGENLVGLQMIDREGAKRYLTGQRTSGAEYLISNNGRGAADWFCEGYATGLSLRQCLQALRMRYRIHITFSASNLVKVASAHAVGYVVADKDESGTGERVAVQTGFPYFLPAVGDFNDLHKAEGTFRASQALRKWLVSQQDRFESSQTDQKSIPNGSQLG